jgi:Na+-translocating ferredoxin:NAD+ oxidoreductase RnfG subunit
MRTGKMFYSGLTVVLTLVICITSLVVVEKHTQAVLESGNNKETLSLLQQIFMEADYYSYDAANEIYTLYNDNREVIGYSFYGTDRGFRGDIDVLIGLKDKETIYGIIVIQQYEDYSYWFKLVSSNFFKQFNGLKIENCFLTGYGLGYGRVDAASGATVSSWGVVDAVRKTSLDKVKYIK